jgi:HTH-type transcriptional regulator / antitoxin HigA
MKTSASRPANHSLDIKVIKHDKQYEDYLGRLRSLMAAPHPAGSHASDTLELLATVLEKYEDERFAMAPVDPIDAISLKMAELGLTQKDLASTLGSASRASEILSRKRALSLEHIRLLHRELRIPAEVLIGQAQQSAALSDEDLKLLPIKEMVHRGWFGERTMSPTDALGQVREFLARVTLGATPVFMRRSVYGGIAEPTRLSTYAWLARVILRAREEKRQGVRFTTTALSLEFLQQVAKLSCADQGPALAQEFLAMKGVVLVIERELPGMKLDGAVIRDDDGTPIVGLTLRHDRLDNFWFTLMHELAHLHRHFGAQAVAFVDDISNLDSTDLREQEADAIALEALIPRAIWSRSSAARLRTGESVEALASELRISPAIVAGRIRREASNYRLLTKYVGQGKVRCHFTNVDWE